MTPHKSFLYGSRVREASYQLFSSPALAATNDMSLLQIQPLSTTTTTTITTTTPEQILHHALIYDELPTYSHHSLPPPEDRDLLGPVSATASHPQLANYYHWEECYPQLRLLLPHFDEIVKEATKVSEWFAWPEYHFREGGEKNDWKVVPFCHTFPAWDETRTQWVKGTCERCPFITNALKQVGPTLRTALLSRLGPMTRLSAHTGWGVSSSSSDGVGGGSFGWVDR